MLTLIYHNKSYINIFTLFTILPLFDFLDNVLLKMNILLKKVDNNDYYYNYYYHYHYHYYYGKHFLSLYRFLYICQMYR